MTRSPARTLALLALLLLEVYAPATDAQHASDLLDSGGGDGTVEDPSLVPGSSPVNAGVWPVDQLLDQLMADANRTGRETFAEAVGAFNAARGEADNNTQQPMVYYLDGMGEGRTGTAKDPRFGGFGPWRVIPREGDDEAWNRSPRANRTGEVGFTNAGSDGTYPFNTRSILLSPELDLRNAFPTPQDGEAPEFGAVWSTIFSTPLCRGAVGTEVCVFDKGSRTNGLLGPRPPTMPDALFQFRFSARFNLAAGLDPTQDGRDGVQVILWRGNASQTPVTSHSDLSNCSLARGASNDYLEEETSDDPSQASCTVLRPGDFAIPDNTYNGEKLANNAPAPAFTGASRTPSNPAGWNEYTIDLTPWAGQSVWIGFSFVSQGPASSSSFDPGMGFRGFQLDNVQLTAPAPPVSLRVRPVSEPAYRPVNLAGPGQPPVRADKPIIAPKAAFNVSTEVVNMGTSKLTVVVHAAAGGTSVASPPTTLLPGESFPFSQAFPDGLQESSQVHTARVNATIVDGNLRVLDDPADNEATREFLVRDVVSWTLRPLTGDAASVRNGEVVAFTLPLENTGVKPVTVSATACLVDWTLYLDPTQPFNLTEQPACDFDPLDKSANGDQKGPRVTMTLEPGKSTSINWTAQADPGQYRLLVQVEEGKTTPNILANATVERILPSPQQPLRSTYRSVKGNLGATADISNTTFWGGVPTQAISLVTERVNKIPYGPFSVAGMSNSLAAGLQFANNATHLFMRLSLPNPGANLYDVLALFDDQGNRQATGATEDGAARFMKNATDWDLHLDPALLRWVADAKEDGSAAHLGSGSSPRVFEFIRPLGTGGQDLKVQASGLLGLHLQVEARSNTGNNLIDRYTFPGFAVAADGGGPVATSEGRGSLDDEMQAWQLVRLAASPASPPRVLVGPGFGVERDPPPLFAVDASDCSAWASWTRTASSTPNGPPYAGKRSETWVCASYGGRNLTFEGTTPDSTCGGRSCPPHSFASRIASNPPDQNSQGKFHELHSPPLNVSGISEPYLVLNHQYATQAWIVDASGYTEPYGDSQVKNYFEPMWRAGGGNNIEKAKVVVASVGRVLMDTLQPDGTWGERVMLTPEGGYSTEEKVGIASAAGPRQVFYGKTAGTVDWDGAIINPAGPVFEPASGCRTGPANPRDIPCGFWWPTGYQPLFAPGAGQSKVFSGSPWTVDRFPLFGEQEQAANAPTGGLGVGDTTSVQASGKTVRFVFQFFPSHEPSAGDPYLQWVRDYGWRIGGLAVQEGARSQRDVGVEDLSVDALFDPTADGVGPGTTLWVKVTLRNSGTRASGPLEVTLRGRNEAGGPDVCPAVSAPSGSLPAFDTDQGASTATLRLPCVIPASADGKLLRLEASVLPVGGDGFPSDNLLVARDVYTVRATRDVAAVGGTPLPTGPASAERLLLQQVENRGNVPLTDIRIDRTLLADQGGVTVPLGEPQSFILRGTLGVGNRTWVRDLRPTTLQGEAFDSTALYRLPGPGAYRVLLRASLDGGDAQPGNDAATVPLRALDPLYGPNPFDSLTYPLDSTIVTRDLSIPEASRGVWSIAQDPQGIQTNQVLHAGGTLGLIPASSDTVVELPALDLTTVKGATLSFQHRYDLEASFDAGRVEISTDNGTTWRPLTPDPAPLAGWPQGYPSRSLVAGPFLEGKAERTAAAYTGQSGGWVPSSFDLGRDPQMRRPSAVDAFSLAGFRPDAASHPVTSGDDNQFRDPTWVLEEANAEGRQRAWWLQDTAYDVAPRNGARMWWSGSPGPVPASGMQAKVNTVLSLHIPRSSCEIDDAAKACVVSWWDWRSGAGDTPGREGSGGRMNVTVNRVEVTPQIVQTELSGWTLRAIDLTPTLAPAGKASILLNFTYDTTSAHALTYDETGAVPQAGVQSNLGFFVEGVQLTRHDLTAGGLRLNPVAVALPGTDLDSPALQLPSSPSKVTGSTAVYAAAPWNVTNRLHGTSTRFWGLVGAGAAGGAPDLGWHTQDTAVPGKGTVRAWRFGSADPQGYPRGIDVRLVTPMVDLTQTASGVARLQFDHAFQFEARQRCPGFSTTPGCLRGFLSAVDGGAVEFQSYDETTGTFGPWQQLGARFRDFPEGIAFSANTALLPPSTDLPRVPDSFTDQSAAASLTATGYNAIAERGDLVLGRNSPPATQPDRRVHAGRGSTFEVHNGAIERTWPCSGCAPVNQAYRMNWESYPVSYVFSGDSGGWRSVDWDISPLAGQKVRFAFHAFSDPSFTPSRAVTGESTMQGWDLANVVVATEVFQGAPAKLRLRLATDLSGTRGSWSLDNVSVAGTRYLDNLALIPATPPTVLAGRGETVDLVGRVANLGGKGKPDLALAIQAVDAGNQPVNVTLVEPRFAPIHAGLPSGFTVGIGDINFTLDPRPALGRAQVKPDSIPFRARVALPAGSDSVVEVRLLLLQRQESADGTVFYDTPRGIEAPGGARAVWTVVGKDELRLTPVPPDAGSTQRMPAAPAAPHANQSVTFRAATRNDGTLVPQHLQANWSFEEVLRKGTSPQLGQPPSTDILGWTAPPQTVMLGALPRGNTTSSQATFTPPAPGLYRATVTYKDGEMVLNASRFEVLVDLPGRYYGVQFGNATQARAWIDASPPPSSGRGGSPPSLRFRTEGGDLVWGVGQADLAAMETYCTLGVCNPPTHTASGGSASNPRPWSYWGLEGIAQLNASTVVDLGRVPQGKAVLTVEHHPRFTPKDGALVEAMPVRLPVDSRHGPQPAFTCNGQPRWFILQPEDGFQDFARSEEAPGDPPGSGFRESVTPMRQDYDTAPSQLHPLDPDELGTQVQGILGGAPAPRLTRFRLDEPALSFCNGAFAAQDLSSFALQIRLHTGTLPGYTSSLFGSHLREGDQGWRVRSLDVSSAAVELSSPDLRNVTMSPAVPKQFSLQLRNAGEIPDTFRLSLLRNASFLPSGAEFRFVGGDDTVAVFLEPGVSRAVPFTVLLPLGPTANFLAVVEARSLGVPSVAQQTQVLLSLSDLPQPDLAAVGLQVAPKPGCGPSRLEAGRFCTLDATVFNLGRQPTPTVKLRFLAIDPAGRATVIADKVPLSPMGCCGANDKTVGTAQWLVPEAVGHYRLRVEADPEGVLVEATLLNNNATLDVEVVPQAVPILVTALTIQGVGPDGLAEEGSFVRLVANVTNAGRATAQRVTVTFEYGNPKPEQVFATLEPGEQRNATLDVRAIAGAVQVKATAMCRECVGSEYEQRKTLHTRGHNLTAKGEPAAFAVAPGASASTQLNVTSHGNGVDQVTFQLVGAPGWGLAVEPTPLTVAPGGNAFALATVRAPANATAGDTVLRVRARPLTNLAAGITFTLTAQVAGASGAPTLAVTSATGEPGPLEVPITLASQSNFPLRLNLTLAGQPWLQRPFAATLAPFATRTVQLPLVIPADTPPGAHAGLVQLRNATGAILAQRLLQVGVLPVPAASAQWGDAILPIASDPGQRALRMSLLVRNDGNVPLTATVSPGQMGPGLTLRGGAASVPVRGAIAIPVEVRVDADAPDPGDGRVEVWVQADAAAAPAPLAVHAASVPLPRLKDAPDLRVARVDRFPAGPVEAGRALRFVAQVENLGPAIAPPSRLFAFANGDLLDDPPVPAIPPGQSRAVNLTVTFEHAGAFLLTLLADGPSAVAELQEANNGAAQELEVQPPPPLSAPGLRNILPAPAAALPGLFAAVLLAASSRRRRGEGE